MFNPKAVLEHIDRQINVEKNRLALKVAPTPKVPTQRFLSPLASGGTSFDRKKSTGPNVLLNYLNQNIEKLDNLDSTIKK